MWIPFSCSLLLLSEKPPEFVLQLLSLLIHVSPDTLAQVFADYLTCFFLDPTAENFAAY